MKRRVKRFNGEDDSAVEDIMSEAEEAFRKRKAAKKAVIKDFEDDETTSEFDRPIKSTADAAHETAQAPKKQSFSAAFAKARAEALRGGPKTFEWNGKKYGTALKDETKPAAKPAPKAPSASISPNAKSRSYDEARIMEAEQRRRMAAQTRAAGTTDMGTLRKSNMDAYLPIDEQRIYSQFKKGGKVKSASARADGCAIRGKTRA